jgi:hypothetical protein
VRYSTQLNPDVVKVISEAEGSGEQLPTFSSIWPEVHPDLMGLVKRMLHWDLRQLPTAAELMMDPVFDEIIDLRGPRVADKVARATTVLVLSAVTIALYHSRTD